MDQKTNVPWEQDEQAKKEHNERWEEYYSNYEKKTAVVSLIEWANRNHYTPMFMNQLYSIVGKKSGLKILEPGSGSGLMSSLLAKENEVTVLDLSQNALNTAKKNFVKIGVKGNFVQGDIFKLPFADNTFDVVWNQGVLEHFDDPSSAMKEMMRVTKQHGHVIIFLPAFLSPLHFVWLFLKTVGLRKLWPFDEQEFFPGKKFRKLMATAGYTKPKVKRLWLKSFNFSQVGYSQKTNGSENKGSFETEKSL